MRDRAKLENVSINVERYRQKLVANDHRVIPRYLEFGSTSRIKAIVHRVAALSDSQVKELLPQVRSHFSARHRDIEASFLDHHAKVKRYVPRGRSLSMDHQRLLGAYFTLEYSIESAALFNPSIVPHPNQSDVEEGAVKFLVSFRATGEGHVSSIVFRRGMVDRKGKISYDPPPRYAYNAQPVANKRYEKQVFVRQLADRGVKDRVIGKVMQGLPDRFTAKQLKKALKESRYTPREASALNRLGPELMQLAEANYDLVFPEDCGPSEIVIFPATRMERQGMEDLRLVRFVEDDGSIRYFGTYTGYDGRQIVPLMLETSDFRAFHVRTLGGQFAANKGLAMFPRRIDGQYCMVSRHDGESLYLIHSDSPFTGWNHVQPLQVPTEPWELVQIGNCGSPIETEAGWILLTHGVGPVRRYCIGAMLLDLNDPSKVLGRLREPLMAPDDDEREGYVPNVVYSCGSMIHGDRLLIPYAMADSATSFVGVSVHELIETMLRDGP